MVHVQSGTYFYHGHLGVQRSGGLYGSLIVDLPAGKKEPFAYDEEHNIVLNDWWHKSIYEQELGLNTVPFRFVGEPQVCYTLISHIISLQYCPAPFDLGLTNMQNQHSNCLKQLDSQNLSN